MAFDLRKLTYAVALVAAGMLAACNDDDDDSGNGPPPGPAAATLTGDISTSRTLSSDTVYTLSGFVRVTSGATLTIEPGTVIVGDSTVAGSSLFILRGARIDAQGTADAPIVLTSQRSPGTRSPGDWGGLIIVGNATINRASPVLLEGTTDVDYSGGTNDADDSGTLRYVRIEFAGYAIAQDTELNSLTMAAVGNGTDIEFVQTLAGLDDSFEWFGGAVNGRYLVSYESGDDHFDAAEGYRGRNQFLIGLQTVRLEPRPGTGTPSEDPQGFEIDGCRGTGCVLGEASEPFNMPVFANFTMVGADPSVVVGTEGGVGMVLRRGTGGTWINGIIARWPLAGISLRDTSTVNRLAVDSLIVNNVLLAENAAPFEEDPNPLADPANSIEVSTATAASLFTSLPAATEVPSTATLDWSLGAASPALTGGLSAFDGAIAARAGDFIQPTSYRGAADPAAAKWWEGWTAYARN